MNCPVCNEALTMTERQGVEIDYCPKCRGVWLDRGELDKIIDRSTSSQPQQPTKPHHESRERYSDRDDYSYDYKKKKKKESFLGELFDF